MEGAVALRQPKQVRPLEEITPDLTLEERKEQERRLREQLGGVELERHLRGEGKKQREVTLKDVEERPEKAERPGASTASGMPISAVGGKSTEVEIADDATLRTIEDGLLGSDKRALVDSAQELSSVAPTLTLPEREELSSEAYGKSSKDFLGSKTSASPKSQEKPAAQVQEGLSYISASADAGDVEGVRQGAEMISEVQEAAEQAALGTAGATSLKGVPAPRLRQAQDSISYLLGTNQSKLGEAGLKSEELVQAAAKAAERLSAETGEAVSLTDVLSEASRAVRENKGNGYSDQLFKELLINRKVGARTDLVKWIEGLFTDEQKQALDKAA